MKSTVHKRNLILKRYPNLEMQLIEWKENYRKERVKALREKRDKLKAELPYIPLRQKDIDKNARRWARKQRREEFEKKNKELKKIGKIVVPRKKGDDLSDTDTDPENEHLSMWSELEELPDLTANMATRNKGISKQVNLIEEQKKREREELRKKGIFVEDEVKLTWRYKTKKEQEEEDVKTNKIKETILKFGSLGWWERFRHVKRFKYDSETNSFSFYRLPKDNVMSEDFEEEPIVTRIDINNLRKE